MLPGPFGNFLAMMARACADCYPDYAFDFMVPERQLLHGAMNYVGQAVLDNDHLGVIVCDDDCLPPYDAIPRLMQHAEAGHPIVAGVGLMRNYPHTTTVGRYLDSGYTLLQRADGGVEWKGFSWYDDLSRLPEGLATVDFCGMPIMWIAREVFEKAEQPWFGTQLDGNNVTHDVYFAKRATEAGFTVKVDTTVRCGHLMAPKYVDFNNRAEIRATEIVLDAMRRHGPKAVEYLEDLEQKATA